MRQRRGSLGEVQDSKVARIDAFENVRVNPPEPSPKPGDLDWGQSREEGGARGGVFFCGRLRPGADWLLSCQRLVMLTRC